jgi:hypothetical protein
MKNNRNELVDALKNGVVLVRFTKVNGEERLMHCTLHESFLPKSEKTEKSTKKMKDESVVTAWDVNKEDWRSFRVENVISASMF